MRNVLKKINLKFMFLIVILYSIFLILNSSVYAITPTTSPSATTTPASPSQGGPAETEEEKVLEIRQAIKDKLTEIKDKIEKKAYVGDILEITDSTLTLSNFRGKQRVRIMEDTVIIGSNKKEASLKDLAVDDRVIAMGEVDANGTLEAKRVVEAIVPATPAAKRITFLGTITLIDPKLLQITLTAVNNFDQTLPIKTDKNTLFINPNDVKAVLKFKDFKENQKLLIVYREPAEGKTAVAKSIFLIP